MKKVLSLVALACAAVSAQAASNVALGSAVTLDGPGFWSSGYWSGASPAAPSTVTDGVYLPTGQQWNIGTVFWSGRYGVDTVTIDLPSLSSVSHIDLQADNNDDYGIEYKDAGGTWHSLLAISPHRSWGMDFGDATFAPVVASAFRISAVGGDGYFSVSEFQAIGAPVPEPETWALMLAGLGAVGLVARRRRAA